MITSISITYDGLGSGDLRRKDIECQLMKKVKVRLMAYKGAFDNVFSPEDLHKAKLNGTLPKGYSVHHIYPLCSREATFSLSNMVVMENKAHKFLHDCLYSPAISRCAEGQSCCIWLPKMDIDNLVTYDSIRPFIEAWIENETRMGRMKSIKYLQRQKE